MGSAVAAQSGTGIALTALVDRASKALAGAHNAAAVLDARDLASVAYDAAKKAVRLAKAKGAHDELVAAGHRAQADALEIEAQAKRRLADEYDDAQERGEIRTQRDNQAFSGTEKASGADIVPPKELHEARIIRDAERADPGIIRRTVDAAIEAGEEPTKARVMRAALETARPGQPEDTPGQSTPNTRFLNVAWDAEHRPSEFDFPSMTNFGALAAAAERVSQSWSSAATELRRLEAQ